MNEVKAIRYAGWAGIIGILLLAASFLVANWTDPADSNATLRADIADADGQAYAAYTMLTPAIALLLWFATGLRRFLLVRCRADRLASAVVPGMAMFTGLTAVGISLVLTVPLADSWYDTFQIDPNAFRALATGGTFAVFAGAVGGAAVVAVTSRAAEVAGTVPRWVAWVGYVVAFLTVFTLWTFGAAMVALGLWLIGAAIGVLRGARSMEAQIPAAAERVAAPAAGTTPGAQVPTQATAPAEEPRGADQTP